jgi:lipopolysaccharide transport system permease protein/teichoic acid transport system permease protein
MISSLLRYRRTIWQLALHQFRDRYSGTVGGVLWAIAHPVLLLLVFWVVFSQGLKLPGAGQQPFLLSLFCALVPWMTFSEIINSGTTAITGRSFMVKKIAFPSEILPITSVVAALITHAIMLVLLGIMLAVYGRGLSPALLLLPYYFAALCLFGFGVALTLSAINVFFRDVGQSVAVALNIWFWLTPIVWPAEMLPASYALLLELNPLYYIVDGYRAALLSDQLVAPPGAASVYYWLLTLALLAGGSFVFRRLKPYFADAL